MNKTGVNILVLSILLITILNLNQVSSQSNEDFDFLAQLDRDYNISIKCDLLGYTCPSSTVCVGNLKYPNSTYVLSNSSLVVENSLIIMPVNASSLNVNGLYKGRVFCLSPTSSLTNQSTEFILKVTPTGTVLSSAQSTIYVILLIFTFIITGVFLVGAINLRFKNERSSDNILTMVTNEKYWKILCIVFSYVGIWAIVYLSWLISWAFLEVPIFTTILYSIFTAMGYMFIPLLPCGVALLIYFAITDKKTLKDLERGLTIR